MSAPSSCTMYGWELYNAMAINAWAETEAWRIPSKSLVELGIVAEI